MRIGWQQACRQGQLEGVTDGASQCLLLIVEEQADGVAY